MVLVPTFITSELKPRFRSAHDFIPFLVIDLGGGERADVHGHDDALPVLVSLPLDHVSWVVDGWTLLMGTLAFEFPSNDSGKRHGLAHKTLLVTSMMPAPCCSSRCLPACYRHAAGPPQINEIDLEFLPKLLLLVLTLVAAGRGSCAC